MNLKKNLNIATILPYKENYTFGKASAASLWVYEFFKKSKFSKISSKLKTFHENEFSC